MKPLKEVKKEEERNSKNVPVLKILKPVIYLLEWEDLIISMF